MRITHVALGDPEGPAHTGYEADCPACRVALLEAFRAPADIPVQDGRRAVEARHPSGGGPHPGWARTTDLGHPQEHANPAIPPDGWLDQDPDIAVHTTKHGITESTVAEGGTWWALCSCGWKANGTYAHEESRPAAARLAQIKAVKHRENPK